MRTQLRSRSISSRLRLTLRGRDGAPFLPRNLAVDEDVRGIADQMDLLYRDAPAFANRPWMRRCLAPFE